MLENPKRSPLSIFFDIVRFFPENKNFSPFNFLMFCYRMDVEKPQRFTFQFFGIVRLFFYFFFSLARQGLALACPGAPLGPFFGFLIFEYCRLTLGSPFAIFEPCIYRRLGPVPACSDSVRLERGHKKL